MFSPTIMLLLGGFTLAAALSKQNIDKVLATKVLSLAGTKPRSILLAYMCVACFASMWISNVAAPVLCYSLIQVRPSLSSPIFATDCPTIVAYSTNSARQIALFEIAHSRNRSRLEHRRNGFSYLLAPESHRSRVHEPPDLLVRLVRRFDPSRLDFDFLHLVDPAL